MKKQTLILGLVMSSNMAFSMGTGVPGADQAKAYLDKLDINPVMLSLAKSFKEAKPSGRQSTGSGVWNPDLALNRNYDCKVFWVLRDREAVIRPVEDSAYHFRPYGMRLLENLSARENVGNTEWFSDDPISPGDLIGRSDDRAIFESVRLDVDGSLIAEIQTREYYYVKYILSLLQKTEFETQLSSGDFKSKGLALPPVIEQNLHLVLGYAYCPVNNAGRSKLQSMDLSILK